MLGKSSMASLAGYSLMHAFAFHLEDVSMTALANLMAGIRGRPRRNLGDRVAAIMSVFPEASRDKKAAHHQEQNDSREKDRCQTEKMTRVFEGFHGWIRDQPSW